ncbi:MAG: flavocytochrome c [Clostridia bacterium]
MKKFLCIALAIMLVVALGVASAEGVSGTFEGTGTGKGGALSVKVTLENDVMTDIEVVSNGETPGFADAMDTLKANMISGNTADVDAVAGCSLTSKGFKDAVNAALTAAGATLVPVAAEAAAVAEKQTIEETHDVVVIGAGGAGFCASIEAKNAGADVILIEKMPMVGGNTLISGAEYAAPANWLQEKEGIEDNVELMVSDMLAGGDNKNDPALVRVVAEGALDGANWLRDEVGVVWEDELMFFGGHSVKRSLIPQGASGVEIITKESQKATALGIPVMLNTRATELITDESGKVVGVKAEGPDANYIYHANKAVILTTGGFGSNVEMRVKYNPDIDGSILSTNSTGSMGDGIVMAENVGAALVDMQYIQTYPICDPLSGALLYFDDARLYGHSVIVNLEGKRFVEELGRRDVMSMAIKAQTGACCYEVIDQNGFDESKLQENHAAELEYLYSKDLLVKADTLDELAAAFGVDAAALKETVTNYNSYVDAGKDPEFNKRSMPSKIEKAPFYMIKAVPAVHHTMGGIKINDQAQVVGTDGQVIEGLYAAGETTGGVHGTNRLGSDALADITVFGRVAGKNASK